jgi:hypothetical protein
MGGSLGVDGAFESQPLKASAVIAIINDKNIANIFLFIFSPLLTKF